jgi:hypothetical protein
VTLGIRHFACDNKQKQINIINIKTNKVILGGSLRDQCYRDYLHGKTTVTEEALSNLEGIFAALARKIILAETISPTDTYDVLLMVGLQRARTLSAEDQLNSMADKLGKLVVNGKIAEEKLKSVKIEVKEAINISIVMSLHLSPIGLDLKQFLLVNDTEVPFVISDNPVLLTNWFSRARHRAAAAQTGLALSGLQMAMPLSPRHSLLLHDSNVYTIANYDNVIRIERTQDVEDINKLQWMNARHNIYFPPGFENDQIDAIVRTDRGEKDPVTFRRLESTENVDYYWMTDKDEYAAPSKGVTRELVQIGYRSLSKDIRIRGISLRTKPRYHDDGSIVGPMRDPAWCRIVEEFSSRIEAREFGFSELWKFVATHPSVGKVGPWLSRLYLQRR